MHRIKWLLVEWENTNKDMDLPQYGVVHIRSLLDQSTELHTGKLVYVSDGSGNLQRAKVVMSSDDRRFLAQQLIAMEEHSQRSGENDHDVSGPSGVTIAPGHHSNIYSPSGSSWSQGNEMQSENDSESSHRSFDFEANLVKSKNLHHITLPALRAKENKTSKSKSMAHINHTVSSKNRRMNRKKQSKFVQRNSYKPTPQVIRHFIKEEPRSIAMTYDQGTQTGPRFSLIGARTLPKIEDKVAVLEQVIDELEEKFSILEATVESWSTGADQKGLESPEEAEDKTLREFNVKSTHPHDQNYLLPNSIKVQPIKKDSTADEHSENDDDNHFNDMVPIGMGNTTIPKHILSQVDWSSYTMATRKLMMAVFPRRTLATHSLTGKSSPAFMNKPAKLCLDREKVNDIVMMVVNKCNVKESLVSFVKRSSGSSNLLTPKTSTTGSRNAITTKCADENKMYRMRQEKHEKRQKNNLENQTNQENIPPTKSEIFS